MIRYKATDKDRKYRGFQFEEEHQKVKDLPNFDADIFYEISRIRL